MSTKDSNDMEQPVQPVQESEEFSGAALGTVNPTTQNPLDPTQNPSQNPTSESTTASGRRYYSQRAAEEQVRSLKQLVTRQTEIISTLTNRLTQITIAHAIHIHINCNLHGSHVQL